MKKNNIFFGWKDLEHRRSLSYKASPLPSPSAAGGHADQLRGGRELQDAKQGRAARPELRPILIVSCLWEGVCECVDVWVCGWCGGVSSVWCG